MESSQGVNIVFDEPERVVNRCLMVALEAGRVVLLVSQI
jgi:hypothetical protein